MNNRDIPNENYLIAIDMFINRILVQAVVFPPLAVEQDTPSLIGHDNISPTNISNRHFSQVESM